MASVTRAALASERRLAGVLGGLLFIAGGTASVVMVVLPGDAGTQERWALAAGLVAVVYGALSAAVIPWERLPFALLHGATVASLGVAAASAAWTGGEQSPLRLVVFFVVVWAACFFRAPVIGAYVAAASAAYVSPLATAPGLGGATVLREEVVTMACMAAVALTVALLRRALVRAQLRASRAAAEHAALREVAVAVAAGRPAEELHALVAFEAAAVLEADAGAVIRFDGAEGVVMGTWTETGGAYPVGTRMPTDGEGVLSRVAHGDGRTVHQEDDVRSGGVRELGYQAVAAAPIRVDDRVWGALAVSTVARGGLPDDVAPRLLDFSALVTTAIVNAEQRASLAARASNDPLTGLANHRTFHERLGAEVRRAQRHGRSLSLVLLDVDTFKSVNDGAGHEAGDRVLVSVADTLRETARAGDVLARIGGDEFGWLMPETGAEHALGVVERAREAIGGPLLRRDRSVTISAGVCDLVRAQDADELFRLADGALYWAKAHGRDAAHVYDPATVRALSAAERNEQLARRQALAGIQALARAIDAKDPTTREHSERVADLAAALARARGWGEDRVRSLHEAALVHDVGKIGIADAILLKPGRLTDAEYEAIKLHAEIGAQIVEDVLAPEQVAWIRGHHERPDGRGYPDGLDACSLSEGAALLALADAYDVMTAARPYSTPKSSEEALAECRELVGRQFTPEAVAALEALEALDAGGGAASPAAREPGVASSGA